MVGNWGGVATMLKKIVQFLLANHCIAHHLALACAQAANDIPYLKRFKSIMDQLYRFYQNSAVWVAGMSAVQELLDVPHLKLTQAKDVWWLSHGKVVDNLCQYLPSVLSSLERESSEKAVHKPML